MKNTPHYFKYAMDNIPCDCDLCHCPSVKRDKGIASFVHVNEQLNFIWFCNPKAASRTMRLHLFNNNDTFSMINPKQCFKDYFSFTIVRNPWDRMVSNWKMFTTQDFRIKQMRAMYDGKIQNFKHFVMLTSKINNHHWQPQVLFIPEKCNFIGKVETLQNDINIISDKIGFNRIKLSRKNVTSHEHYSKYYDVELRKFIAERYKEDIDTFGYVFETL